MSDYLVLYIYCYVCVMIFIGVRHEFKTIGAYPITKWQYTIGLVISPLTAPYFITKFIVRGMY